MIYVRLCMSFNYICGSVYDQRSEIIHYVFNSDNHILPVFMTEKVTNVNIIINNLGVLDLICKFNLRNN